MKIKQTPEDFIVDEISLIKPKNEGEYTYFQLKKTNWTTQRAIQQICRRLGVSKKRLGFAGNKDKFAVTTQVCSLWNIEPKYIDEIRIKDIEIKVLGKGNERINLGDLKCNKFKIKITEVSEPELVKFNKNFKNISKNGFLNLFGEQRFGSAGNSGKIGNSIINGNLEEAVKLFITEHGDNKVAQEFGEFAKKNWKDWKAILSKCPKFLGLENAVLNWLVKVPTDFGGALRNIPKPTRRLFVSAYQSKIWNDELLKAKEKGKIPKIIKIAPIEIKRMPELEMLGTERETTIKAKNLKKKINKDTIEIEFELQKGAYATELIRQLFV